MYLDREQLGQFVRLAFAGWAKQLPNPKASWLLAWEEIEEWERELDRHIGEFLAVRIREEETQNMCGLYPLFDRVHREIVQAHALQEVTDYATAQDWAEFVGREVMRASAESFSHGNFCRRMVRVAAFAILAVASMQRKAERDLHSMSSRAPLGAVEMVT